MAKASNIWSGADPLPAEMALMIDAADFDVLADTIIMGARPEGMEDWWLSGFEDQAKAREWWKRVPAEVRTTIISELTASLSDTAHHYLCWAFARLAERDEAPPLSIVKALAADLELVTWKPNGPVPGRAIRRAFPIPLRYHDHKRQALAEILADAPDDISDRELARRIGASPASVKKWREEIEDAGDPRSFLTAPADPDLSIPGAMASLCEQATEAFRASAEERAAVGWGPRQPGGLEKDHCLALFRVALHCARTGQPVPAEFVPALHALGASQLPASMLANLGMPSRTESPEAFRAAARTDGEALGDVLRGAKLDKRALSLWTAANRAKHWKRRALLAGRKLVDALAAKYTPPRHVRRPHNDGELLYWSPLTSRELSARTGVPATTLDGWRRDPEYRLRVTAAALGPTSADRAFAKFNHPKPSRASAPKPYHGDRVSEAAHPA